MKIEAVTANQRFHNAKPEKAMCWYCKFLYIAEIFPPVRLFQTVRLLLFANLPDRKLSPDRTFIPYLRVVETRLKKPFSPTLPDNIPEYFKIFQNILE